MFKKNVVTLRPMDRVVNTAANKYNETSIYFKDSEVHSSMENTKEKYTLASKS